MKEQKVEVLTYTDKNTTKVIIDDIEIHGINNIKIEKDAEQNGLTSLTIKLNILDNNLKIYQGISEENELINKVIEVMKKEAKKHTNINQINVNLITKSKILDAIKKAGI